MCPRARMHYHQDFLQKGMPHFIDPSLSELTWEFVARETGTRPHWEDVLPRDPLQSLQASVALTRLSLGRSGSRGKIVLPVPASCSIPERYPLALSDCSLLVHLWGKLAPLISTSDFRITEHFSHATWIRPWRMRLFLAISHIYQMI